MFLKRSMICRANMSWTREGTAYSQGPPFSLWTTWKLVALEAHTVKASRLWPNESLEVGPYSPPRLGCHGTVQRGWKEGFLVCSNVRGSVVALGDRALPCQPRKGSSVTCRQSSPTLKMAACQQIFLPSASCPRHSSSASERHCRPGVGEGHCLLA